MNSKLPLKRVTGKYMFIGESIQREAELRRAEILRKSMVRQIKEPLPTCLSPERQMAEKQKAEQRQIAVEAMVLAEQRKRGQVLLETKEGSPEASADPTSSVRRHVDRKPLQFSPEENSKRCKLRDAKRVRIEAFQIEQEMQRKMNTENDASIQFLTEEAGFECNVADCDTCPKTKRSIPTELFNKRRSKSAAPFLDLSKSILTCEEVEKDLQLSAAVNVYKTPRSSEKRFERRQLAESNYNSGKRQGHLAPGCHNGFMGVRYIPNGLHYSTVSSFKNRNYNNNSIRYSVNDLKKISFVADAPRNE